jgi:hypothetical protein
VAQQLLNITFQYLNKKPMVLPMSLEGFTEAYNRINRTDRDQGRIDSRLTPIQSGLMLAVHAKPIHHSRMSC